VRHLCRHHWFAYVTIVSGNAINDNYHALDNLNSNETNVTLWATIKMHEPEPFSPLRVMVVEDFADGRELLTEFLTFNGFLVSEATNGAEALESARRELPDVILMDLQTPTLDGWEATRRLKADPRTMPIVVVAVTAHALQYEVDRARAAGCDAVVTKPFDIALLADALSRVGDQGGAAFDVVGLSLTTQTRRAGRRANATQRRNPGFSG
jgi:two-component system cell cycle response regulator DivK